MTHGEIREKFLKFFESKGHKIVPSSSLLPDDPSVLFTTAGMQQFKPYYTGKADAQKDFGSLNTASIQKSIRTSDIDEVGDESHLTFFEMLGNFSFGGYFKKEAIQYAYEFITKEMGLTIDYVSVFGGEGGVLSDEESEKIWKSLDPSIVVKKFGRADNFWGPTGEEGPCGPTTEVYVNGIEIWNIVFNQYYQNKDKTLEPLKTPGIDTGMGLERLVMVAQKVSTVFETDLFQLVISNLPDGIDARVQRIIADHVRAISFLVSDGITPSNKDQGYVLRRLMRRIIVHKELNPEKLFEAVVNTCNSVYPELNLETILTEFTKEKEKFSKTLDAGLRVIMKGPMLDAAGTFKIYESFGVPYEVVKDVDKTTATQEEIDTEFKKHQEKSRAGAEKKFGGHGLLLDTGELKAANEEELKKVTRLHTATHLLQAALRKVLGEEVHQAGSDITVERTRFDFIFDRKLTSEELQEIEALVNEVVQNDLPFQKTTLPKEEAEKTGALYFFKEKYPDPVDVYYAGESLETAFSKEFCGGPHVTHTGEIGKFKIIKEEAVSAGVRRIRAIVE